MSVITIDDTGWMFLINPCPYQLLGLNLLGPDVSFRYTVKDLLAHDYFLEDAGIRIDICDKPGAIALFAPYQ